VSDIGTTAVQDRPGPAAASHGGSPDRGASSSFVFDATIGIARADHGRIEASIDAACGTPSREDDIRDAIDGRFPRREARVEARGLSSGALADANPFLWFQLFDRGVAVTNEAYLGRGVGSPHRVRAQIGVREAIEPSPGGGGRSRGTSHSDGLEARVVARTYGGEPGPQYWVEVIVMPLLACRNEVMETAC